MIRDTGLNNVDVNELILARMEGRLILDRTITFMIGKSEVTLRYYYAYDEQRQHWARFATDFVALRAIRGELDSFQWQYNKCLPPW